MVMRCIPRIYAATKCRYHKGKICIEAVTLCKLHLVAASRSYRLVPKMVLILCNLHALVVFFLPSNRANTALALMVIIVTCAGGVFP